MRRSARVVEARTIEQRAASSGQQWRTVESYTRWLDLVMLAAVIIVTGRLLHRRLADA